VLEAHDRPKPLVELEACHGNGVRTDNHSTNLRWDTKAANRADMLRHQAERQAAAAVTPQPAETLSRYRLQVRWGGVAFRTWRYGVTGAWAGDAAKGTEPSLPFILFRPFSLFFNPALRSLRSLRAPGPRRSP